MDGKGSRWRRLDNAAKIFPATSNKRDTRVFRFSCVLKETVDGRILQKALDRTMEVYPLFQSVLRKGLFWFYLEKHHQKPVVKEESKPPCSMLYVPDQKSLLFEVTYYQRSIHFEVFHVLTDGTGATQFLKELVKNYLYLAHEEFEEEIQLQDEKVTNQDKEDDGFAKYHTGSGISSRKKKPHAFQIRGTRTDHGELLIEEGIVSTKALLAKAKEYQVSVSVLVTAVLLCAIHREMGPRQQHRPVILMVPVNLRNFFPSNSMLNFFSWIEPGYQFTDQKEDFEEVLRQVKEYFKKELTKEGIGERMNKLTSLEYHPVLRLAPLELKNIFLHAGAKIAERDVTAIYSNMGVVSMPEAYEKYIELFHVYTSTPKIELCMCSFKEKMAFSFTSRFVNQNYQRNFFRILQEIGIAVEPLQEERPAIQRKEYPEKKFMQYFSFFCIALAVIMAMINQILTPDKRWAVFGAGGIFSTWLVLAVGFFKRRNFLKNAMWQQVLIIAASLIWDAFTGWRGWALNYVFPGVALATICALLVIRKIQRLRLKECMIYFLLAGVAGIIPGILLAADILNVAYPSVLCTGISVLLLTGIAIFRGKELKMELHKKFHL